MMNGFIIVFQIVSGHKTLKPIMIQTIQWMRITLSRIRKGPHPGRIGRDISEIAMHLIFAKDRSIDLVDFFEDLLVESRRLTLCDHDTVFG